MSRAAESTAAAPAAPSAWADVVARYLEALRLTHYAAATVHFRWLTKQRVLPANPAAELELPRVTAQRLPQPLTDAEITEVLAHADPTTPIGLRNRALLETAYSTGLRRMELIRLRLYDLDLARGVVVVREGKGRKDRVVPIGERAIAWLEKYLDEARPEFVAEPDEGTVFLTRRGRPFHPNNLSR